MFHWVKQSSVAGSASDWDLLLSETCWKYCFRSGLHPGQHETSLPTVTALWSLFYFFPRRRWITRLHFCITFAKAVPFSGQALLLTGSRNGTHPKHAAPTMAMCCSDVSRMPSLPCASCLHLITCTLIYCTAHGLQSTHTNPEQESCLPRWEESKK